jgi:hypothetical protein
MRSTWRPARLASLILTGLMLAASALAVRASNVIGPAVVEEGGGGSREHDSPGSPEQPAISFIDSPSANCYQPDRSRDQCYISWSYLYVTAGSSQYVISMTVSIGDRLRASMSGFFQASMYLPADLFGRGFKVACGPRRADGLGNTYAYTLRARETGGLSAANYGSVRCPGLALVYAPLVRR